MKAAQSVSQIIAERIKGLPPGELFTPSALAGLGSRASVDQTLTRLTKVGHIERLGRGLYALPRTSRFGLKAMPSPEDVAKTVAASEGASIEVQGAEAARRFGLSTQVPTQPTFYTTGSSHTVRLGKLQVRLKHVSARKMALAGRPAGQALLALWYLGRKQVTSSTFDRLASALPPEEFKALCSAQTVMPAWMVEALRYYNEKAR